MIFSHFLSTVLQEMLSYLSKHPDFFDKKEAEREASLHNMRIPKVFKPYLANVKGDAFMADLHLVLRYSNRGKDLNLKDSGFFKAFAAFLTGPFAGRLDQLFDDFALMSGKDQDKVLDKLIDSDSAVAGALKKVLKQYSAQQISEQIVQLTASVSDAPMILVQTPREASAELKKDVRARLVEESPGAFPVFQINRKLIGGLRVFKNGTSVDHSWLSRVHRFISLTSA